ncbi:MAG TPA: galactokinase [Terrimicrobiaceae bacterium]
MVEQLFERTFGRSPQARAYAPGRIEFIGNHTDYNGGCALGAAVDRGISVAIAARNDRECHFVSEAMNQEVVAALDHITPLANSFAWANYPLGVIHVLREEGFSVGQGIDLAVASSLPAGAGMSSSAAFELATAYGLAVLNGFEVDRKKMVQVCRRAENEFVGMPCGILDQGTSAFGAPDHLVHVDCLTETFTQVPMPGSCHLWIFNSNKKHSLVDSKYSERHRECSEAFEILRHAEPEAACLAHVSPSTVRAQQRELGETGFKRALHVTEENLRVKEAVEALKSGRLEIVGALLTASHQSSKTLFENSCAELDYLVELLTDLPGVYGARLTGGGFGGAVMALTDTTFEDLEGPAKIASCYTEKFGIEPTIFHTRTGKGAGQLVD